MLTSHWSNDGWYGLTLYSGPANNINKHLYSSSIHAILAYIQSILS